MNIGAQFFTIRDFCKTTEELAESLKRVADIGYKTIQLSGVCPFDAAWMKEQLRQNGLSCVLTHTAADRLIGEPEKVAAEHDIFGCRYVGLGWYNFTEKGQRTTADFFETYLPVAEALQSHGKYFMYHNHDMEFRREDGRLILDCLADGIPADKMGFTLDTFWIQAGGGDPAWWIEKLSGRVPCIHLKDFAYGRKMAVVGEGNLNFDRIFAAAADAGTEYILVEQDDCNGEDPFDCLRRSYAYLQSRGFE